jgi:FkbM family methyltransferase
MPASAMRSFGDVWSAARPSLRIIKTAFFAQYAEDAIVFLALKPSSRGFYVDSGAFHPTEGSNTYKLYLKGWHGLTVEPNPAMAPLFRRMRPRDHHLTEGISLRPTDGLLWHEFANPTMNTMSADRASHLRRHGFEATATKKIVCRPLQDIIDTVCPGQHIDLLSVDCEGMDLEVLQSLDYGRCRPTSILVEDLAGYYAMRDGAPPSAIARYVRDHGYHPIAQMLYSFLYIAEDWRELMKKSAAFDPRMIQNGLLP